MFKNFQPLTAIAVTPQAIKVLLPLMEAMGGKLLLPEALGEELDLLNAPLVETYGDSLALALAQQWTTQKAFIFGLATGAAVRLIAPLLESKQTDPAVVVVDGPGKVVISLLGGHQGGGGSPLSSGGGTVGRRGNTNRGSQWAGTNRSGLFRHPFWLAKGVRGLDWGKQCFSLPKIGGN